MLRERLEQQQFVITMEVDPPRGANPWPVYEKIQEVSGALTAVNIADSPTAKLRMSPIALAYLVQENLKLETIFHLTCRDRNLLGLQAELLGAWAMGVKNILTLTGDDPKIGDHPQATGVFDVDSMGLAYMAGQLNIGQDYLGHTLSDHTDFFIGAVANPAMDDLGREAARVQQKIAKGVQFFQTQPIYSQAQVCAFQEAARVDVPVIYGIMPLKSAKQARYMNAKVPGVKVPQAMIEVLEAQGPEGGMEYLCQMVSNLYAQIDGIHIFPMGDYHLAQQLIEVVG